MNKIRAIRRTELENIRNNEISETTKDYLNNIIKNGTKIWRKDNRICVHLGMNDYIIYNENVNKELNDILDKVNIEETFEDIIDINTIATFENQFGKKEYIEYLL